MKTSVITILFLTITFVGFSQNKDKKERIKTLKIAFLTERLELTETEAQKFWPIYNAHETEMDMLRMNAREKRRNLKVEGMTEDEAKQALSDMLAFEHEEQQLKSDLVESLLTAIPAKKIIALYLAEKAFNRRIFEEMKKRKNTSKGN